MSIAEKLTAVAENEQKVYDAGRAKAERDFWDVVQQSGSRTNYDRAFRYWDTEAIVPKHKVTATGAVTYLFCDCANLKTIDRQHFDFSNMQPTFVKNEDAYAMFCRCGKLEYMPDLGLPPCSVSWMFAYCEKLRTIEILRVSENTIFTDAFAGCYALENITIEGTVGNDIYLGRSDHLTHDSLMSIINALKDYSGTSTTKTLTIGTTNQAKLTDAEKAIATQKGWTIA